MSEYQKNHNQQKTTVVYSVLTFVLLIFILQAGFGMVVNIVRNIDTYAKLKIVSNAHSSSLKKNNNLKYALESFNSSKSLESIARNNLKMAAENEILVVINSKKEDTIKSQKEKPEKKKGIFYKR